MPTLNQSIAWGQSVLATYIPLTSQTGSEPAITIANMVVAFLLSPPFTWPTNRAEDSSTSTVAGTQDYTINLATFGFLEGVTLTDASSKSYAVKNIYNNRTLGKTSEQTNRPEACGVKFITPGTSVAFRFLAAPDAIYTITATYQKIPVLFTATTQDWNTQCGIPPNQIHIYNNLFLAECFQVNGDPAEAGIYRRRGMASLLATAEGLSEMQKNMMFDQATNTNLSEISANLRTQSAAQARTI